MTPLAIVGCTATGKSALAVDVAVALGDTEILTADSMQLYRGMDVGTAKPTDAERRGIPHHLVDLGAPDEEFSVARYQAMARVVIDGIEARGKRPLLVGGTGLYVRAVVDSLAVPGQWPAVRAELDAEPDTAGLHARLAEVDPTSATRMEPSNRRRIVRALEVTLGSGKPFSSFGPGLEAYPPTPWRQAGIRVPRELLRARIRARLAAMIDAGFVDEVRGLGSQPLSRTAAQALGYRELLAHVAGECTLDEALEATASRTIALARRQDAWFRRDPRIRWFDVEDDPAEARNVLVEWASSCEP